MLLNNVTLFRQQTKIFKFVEVTVKVTVLCPFVPCVAANCFPCSNYFCVNTELAPVRHKYSELNNLMYENVGIFIAYRMIQTLSFPTSLALLKAEISKLQNGKKYLIYN